VGRKVVGTVAARAAVRTYLAAFDILPIDRQALLDADVNYTVATEFIERVQSGSLELPALQLAGLWWLQARLKGLGVPGTSIPFP